TADKAAGGGPPVRPDRTSPGGGQPAGGRNSVSPPAGGVARAHQHTDGSGPGRARLAAPASGRGAARTSGPVATGRPCRRLLPNPAADPGPGGSAEAVGRLREAALTPRKLVPVAFSPAGWRVYKAPTFLAPTAFDQRSCI